MTNAKLINLLREARGFLPIWGDLSERIDAALEESLASTVCVFQFPSGRWGWVVTSGSLAGGQPCDTQEEAITAGEELARRLGWPPVRTSRRELPSETVVTSIASTTAIVEIQKGFFQMASLGKEEP